MAHEESRGMTTSEETGSLIAIEGKKEREGVDGEKVLEGTSLVEGTEGGLENAISIFSGVRDSFLQEHQKREAIRSVVQQLENTSCGLVTHFSLIHQTPHSKLAELCNSSEPLLKDVQQQLSSLSGIIPPNHYYKYHDHWRCAIQRVSFLISLKVFLESLVSGKTSEALVTRDSVSATLGGFQLDLEDYLIGLLMLTKELSRLSVNSVILGDYNVPIQILSFVNDLSSGFRLLNLKNDTLRRRFDSLKYDTKKVEEVVYDMKIRGLV